MPAADRNRWVDLWDPSRYLPQVSMPILFVNGTNDFAYPLDSYMKSFDAVPAPKQLRITVNMPHGHPPGWAPQEIGLFVDHYLRDRPGLPRLNDPLRDASTIRVPWEGPSKLVRAALHFTTDKGPINKRTWQTRAGTVEDHQIVAASPPADATAWFVTGTDERSATVSTRVLFGGQ
jgi:PhoPQ-activated pathogenicity-related protein